MLIFYTFPEQPMFNEWYVRDTSRKITTVLRARGMSGVHTSNHCPYGYKKDPADNTKWLVDEEAAEVVRSIYRLCIAGKGPYDIARILAEDKIEKPSYYQAKRGLGTPFLQKARREEYFNDGSHIIYVNAGYKDDTELGKLTHDFSVTEPDDMNFKVLANAANYYKKNKEGMVHVSNG